MASDDWLIVRLNKKHRRDTFDCGSAELNEYIRKFARQNDRKDIGRTYVAVLPNEAQVRGYYTLATSSIGHDLLPDTVRKTLPRYPIPTALIGRLGVDNAMKGQGLGQELLMDGIYKVLQAGNEMGLYAIEVHAKDTSAQAFYAKYGFASLIDEPTHMFLSLKAAARAFS